MRFNGKADVKAIFGRFSKSLRSRKDSTDAEEEVDAITNSFIGDEVLRDFHPRGRAGMEIVGTTADGALDMDFTWDDSDAEDTPKPKEGDAKHKHHKHHHGPLAAELVLDGESPGVQHPHAAPPLVRQGGRVAAVDGQESAGATVRPAVPPLSVVMLVCGTRGDVQPFIALALQLKEYGHRVRIATHKDYRAFVTAYDLEFYPLGGDPKVLSDFIVKHRGVFTIDTKDAFENIKQVEDVVFSTWAACTRPDYEGDGKPFKAQAIIANPPSYGHIHCAEKLRVPLHIYFTMPWTPTRTFPHPLARIKNVRDTRPSSIAIRNYLSYVIVNEYTYTGLSGVINRFRREKLNLQPLRLGNSGANILDSHDVPFAYCWSPSLVAKPSDWDDHVDVTGYFFLNEGVRSSYQPPKELADFLAGGSRPVYIGFGSLMVDDHEKVTQKILDAIEATGQRLLLSKGWAGLGEGFELPDTVMLLDDVPHDWLLPQCCAVVHHGGAGTTAAGLLAACPTTVIPFFGDQTFWGSAVFRRGVGPRPIPIDTLTSKKLISALEYMQRPEVKAEAVLVSEQIKQEDGVGEGLRAFHQHLPVEDILAGHQKHWELAKPSLANFFTELGGGIADFFVDPIVGARQEGVKGAIKGLGKGLESILTRPLKGLGLAGYSLIETVHVDNLKCLQPQIREDEGEEVSVLKAKPAAEDGGTASSSTSSQGKPHPQGEGPSPDLKGLNLDDSKKAASETPLPSDPEQPQLQGLPSLKGLQYRRTFSFRMAPLEESSESQKPAAEGQGKASKQERGSASALVDEKAEVRA